MKKTKFVHFESDLDVMSYCTIENPSEQSSFFLDLNN